MVLSSHVTVAPIGKSSGDVWNVYSKVQRILGRHAFACLTNQPLFMTMYVKFLFSSVNSPVNNIAFT